MTRVASLGMYEFPWLAWACDAVWAGLRDRLRAAAIADVPEGLERSRELDAIWRDPALLLGQTCGYPLMTALRDSVRLVATPCYDLPGCAGALHRSFIVVRLNDPAGGLADLRGRRCAINAWDSNTGMNLLRAAVAPLAGGGRFFADVVVTGAHLESLRAVREGRADVAAIDCVTHGLAARHRPELLTGTRVLTETAASPGLPLITSAGTPDGEVDALRGAVSALFGDPALHEALDALAWVGTVTLGVGDYAIVERLEREAEVLGFASLASS